MDHSCVAVGSFHQGDLRFTESNNAQCMANSACALAWQVFCGGFSTNAIDEILMAGDRLYNQSRREYNVMHRYLFPEDLARNFVVANHHVTIEEISNVGDGLYPRSYAELDDVTTSLTAMLETAMSGDSVDGGFVFTGQLVAVAFWRYQGRLYLFDSHAVNESRRRDIDEVNNKARLFVCDGLVQDEKEYHYALREAATFMTGPRLRSFFVILCNMGAPAALLWDAFRDSICEDHIERNPLDVELAYKLSLIEIDRSLRRQGSCVADHGLPDVHDDTTELGRELLLHGENQQRAFVEEWVPKLSEDQNRVFEYVTSVLNAPASGTSSKIIFLDGPGGYGKTTLIRVILAYVRGCRQVALAVASSGIAAGNMPGGTTAHSMFRLPLDFGDGTGFWNITNGSQRAELIRAARLIVFDEAPMAHRFVFEVLDRSLRDLMRSSELFGGKIFLCCGDFRQIAPVVVNARTPSDIVCVSLRASHLWQHFKIFALTTAHRTSSSTAYSDFLLGVGNGTVSSTTFLEGRNEQSLIPLLGIRQVTSLTDLVDSVFPANVLLDSDLCSRRAILSTLIVNVKEINDHILNSLDGHLYELRSADTVDRENDDGLDVDVQLLNTATGKGVPDHVLRLKIGSVCLIMRNLDIAEGLVNGTKVIVIGITNRLITVRLPGQTQPIGIPRITFTFAFVEGSPLRVRRRQFPLMLAYCMTGHKSQGQTIDSVGVDLRTDCFTHGQLYVLLSRVRHPDHIVVLVHPERVRDGIAYAKNIVYGDLLL
ncbi:ATP-dependent DNA helicase PIF1-like [Macrosteles quadrilineatus]|uniref:ATP-dependent DNA helicase PIF1-like n=1 Tax=Macrosteles quadrilineatus TaxID=74068 RepID=UPI0023E32615|nr:ATP-dependent DNA helicase PIF1-like [Macrosteles quadrilineatus]